jgi:F420-non-reducing hydrogenase small subunit
MSDTRPKLAVYWASACGGCEIAFVNLGERLLEVTKAMNFVFCPCLLDGKRKDIEALADGELAVTLFDGAIRTDENEDWARLMRRKSKILVAMGACASGGGIPALSNLHTRQEHLHTIYFAQAENPGHTLPCQTQHLQMPEGTLEMPRFHERVRRLADVVAVDYTIPGCPPEAHQIWFAMRSLIAALQGSAPLPPHGAVLGTGAANVCGECPRKRSGRQVARFRRVWEFEPDPEICLVEQGVACMGLATRGGCGSMCPAVQMPCIGCYGPPEGVYDQSAKMVSVLGSVLDIEPLRGLRDEAAINARVDAALDGLPDIAGLAGKFHLVRGPGVAAAGANAEGA